MNDIYVPSLMFQRNLARAKEVSVDKVYGLVDIKSSSRTNMEDKFNRALDSYLEKGGEIKQLDFGESTVEENSYEFN